MQDYSDITPHDFHGRFHKVDETLLAQLRSNSAYPERWMAERFSIPEDVKAAMSLFSAYVPVNARGSRLYLNVAGLDNDVANDIDITMAQGDWAKVPEHIRAMFVPRIGDLKSAARYFDKPLEETTFEDICRRHEEKGYVVRALLVSNEELTAKIGRSIELVFKAELPSLDEELFDTSEGISAIGTDGEHLFITDATIADIEQKTVSSKELRIDERPHRRSWRADKLIAQGFFAAGYTFKYMDFPASLEPADLCISDDNAEWVQAAQDAANDAAGKRKDSYKPLRLGHDMLIEEGRWNVEEPVMAEVAPKVTQRIVDEYELLEPALPRLLDDVDEAMERGDEEAAVAIMTEYRTLTAADEMAAEL